MKRNSLLLQGIIVIFLLISLPAFSQEPVDIIIERDSVILKGKFYKAAGDDNKPVVILLQGSPGNTYDVLGLGRSLSRSGINAMTFNYSGSHQSTGTFSFPNCQAEIGATFRFLHRPDVVGKFRIDTTAIILAGYSFCGGQATDLGPFNAVSIGIPFILDRISPLLTGILHKPPEVPMIYVLYMPVTTEKARKIGFEIASYPESLAEISFEIGDKWISCKVDTEGENILTLSGRKINLNPSLRERVYPITLQRDRCLLRSEFNFSECESGVSTKQSDVRLEFGNHPIGIKLKELNFGKVLRYQYWRKQKAILTMASESYTI